MVARRSSRAVPSVQWLTILGVALCLVLSACGRETGAGSGSGGGGNERFDIIFLSNFSGNVTLRTLEQAIQRRGEKLGAKVKVFDAQLDIQKQVNQAEQAIALNPDAIISSAMDPVALFPVLERASQSDVDVFGFDVNFKEDPAAYGPIIAQVTQGRANGGAEAAKFYAEKLGGKGKIAIVDIGFPVPSLQFLISEFKRNLKQEAPGIEIVETVGNKTDDAEGARPLVDQLLTKYSDLDGVFCYNDPSAVGAAAAAGAVGRKDLLITGFNASPDGIEALKAGRIAATWDVRPVDMGITIVDAAVGVLKGERDASSLEKSLPVPSKLYTKDNVGDFVPWERQLAGI